MKVLIGIILFGLVSVNYFINQFGFIKKSKPLVCINDKIKQFSFGHESQMADLFWVRFLQETDAFNELKIAEPHLCPDKSSSWHYHILNVAFDLDPKFYEMASIGPLVISITISDSVGSSKLFDKAVQNFPNDWKILYQASYQAQFEEGNLKKAAELLYRAGQNGAPRWVLSLAGGLYNEVGMKEFAESVYQYLESKFPDDPNTQRLKDKLNKKVQNYFKKNN